ncbi:MAG: hypothetical protein A2Y07_11815 [Planctomycetes bacterium GWF2_50_10]|nr:MAG: hypothetical protein A2Y07_11815 [Planctomycetes bacterium GWF2_50_10]
MDPKAHNDLDVRIERARQAMENCMLCPRLCGANRLRGEKGYCSLDACGYCFRSMVVNYEEYGLNPSHQLYFSGCNLRCEFCSVGQYNIEPCQVCPPTDTGLLAKDILQKQAAGAKTLNLLGGEPAVNLYAILQLLKELPVTTRVVWNSNMYYGELAAELLDGLVDIYLADLKCGNNDCGCKLLWANNYRETAKMRIKEAACKAQTIVRHVLMPGHFECCTRPVLEWIAAETPDAAVSIKGDYVPPAHSQLCPLEYVSSKELERAVTLARDMGLKLVHSGK